jgi:hypothetical protein
MAIKQPECVLADLNEGQPRGLFTTARWMQDLAWSMPTNGRTYVQFLILVAQLAGLLAGRPDFLSRRHVGYRPCQRVKRPVGVAFSV